ncbi:MAG: hypothetical protein IJT04_05035 [Bacteroidales bacterium]|nr:hypothetical protein [Bacteroidales bacterium]
MKKFKSILIICLVLAVLVIVVVSAVRIRKQTCEAFVVKIENMGENKVFSAVDVENLLRAAGQYPVGKVQKSIKREALSNVLSANVWFDRITSLSRKGNELLLVVSMKKPLVRVFPQHGASFLLDTQGGLLPDSSGVLDRLPVLNGSIKTNYKKNATIDSIKEKSLLNAYEIISKVSEDECLAAQFPQFVARPNGELDMYSVVGNQMVHVGWADNIDEKLQNLHIIYADALAYMNMNDYSQLDIRYKNRIFATKKE